MSNERVTGLRSIDFAVRDLAESTLFYTDVWGLRAVSRDDHTVYLAGAGHDHHLLSLQQGPVPKAVAINLAAADQNAVTTLYQRVATSGATNVDAPAQFGDVRGGGYGFGFNTPDGHRLTISCDVATASDPIGNHSIPERLSHIVLNVADYENELEFYQKLLGFRVIDTVPVADFLCCNNDHHIIALSRGKAATMNHLAFEMPDMDGLMYAAGRVKTKGLESGWGVGRHGPGNNVFSYYVDPNGLAIEYTTGMEKVDENTEWHGPDYWANPPFLRPDRWGLAPKPSDEIMHAFSGVDQ